MDPIDTSIRNLRALVDEHNKMGMKILKAAGGKLYPLDLLTIAVMNRSVALLTGFCDLLEKRNFVAAAPLLRMQLDNLLRFHAAWLVDKPHDFAMSVFQGERIRDLKDRNGKKMTDAYLVGELSKQHPGLSSIYEHTSGYVHLSEKHIFNSMTAKKGPGQEFNMKISAIDGFVPKEIYLEAMQAFLKITGILFSYLQGWALTKDGPAKKDI